MLKTPLKITYKGYGMDDVTHTVLVIAMLYISYKIGNMLGSSKGYSDGFLDGSESGIGTLMDFLRKEYHMNFDYKVTVEVEDEN